MQPQEQQDLKSISLFRQLIALVVFLILLATIAERYFGGINTVSANSLALEHNRLLNVLAMVRSQWQSLGKPQRMTADWLLFENGQATNTLVMDRGGWPTIDTFDAQGCEQLWFELLGVTAQQADVATEFDGQQQICHFRTESGQSISYQISSGQVAYSGDVAN
ncbi:hypothetical protein HR45_08160 [Shewanella mangrovi]|uniref:MSHA biogenesis protein MshF n=1 Tax=Shewanella mangrovi TaxID=1515746 RepID=A0A094JD39_9GAMM|nr:hypothetical protein [Shewanella mangrovi]KFZ37820.1 hypothetical protein HR45_08160 [Shewanella mangrovi]